MSNYKAPCKNCTERSAVCHGKCEKYKAFRAEQEKLYAEREKVYHEADPVAGYLRSRSIARAHKKSKRGKYTCFC